MQKGDMDQTLRQLLLSFARQTIRAHLSGQPLPEIPSGCEATADLGGAFVTLKNAGRLRGCIGRFSPTEGLGQTVQQMAIAALSDWRFHDDPITLDELNQLNIEISILSPMKRTNDPLSLELGVHGIMIRKGGRSGCFLPQVAREQNWSKEQFLSRCCTGKAGLPANAWKDSDTEVFLFAAEAFHENDPGV